MSALCVSVVVADARAADYVWSGGGTSANWTNVFNWEGLSTPDGSGDAEVEFPGNAARARSVVNQSYTIRRLDFVYGTISVSRAFTLDASDGAVLTLNASIRNENDSPQTLNVPVVLAGGGTHNVGNSNTGSIRFNESVSLNGGTLVSDNGGGRVTFAAPLTGNGSLVVAGSGTVQLAAGNTFAGAFEIRGGTLEFATGNQLGSLSNTIAFDAGPGQAATTLRRTSPGTTVLPISIRSASTRARLHADAEWTHAATIGGDGGLAKDGGGTLTLTGALTYASGTRIDAGELFVAGDARLPDRRLELRLGTRLSYGAGIADTVGSLAGDGGTVALATGTTLTVGTASATAPEAAGTGTFAGEIVGAAALVKDGAGSLVLKGPSFYTGGTTIVGGALVADDTSGGSATGPGAVEVRPGARLEGDGRVGGVVTVRAGAIVSPADGDATPGAGTGSLAVGGLLLEPNAAVRIELDGATAGFTIDQLNVTGDATLTGATLDLRSLANFDPALTLQPTPIVTIAGQRSGRFARVEGVVVTPAASLAVTYDGQAVRVRTARPGDATLDASVNFGDLVLLAQNYGPTTGKMWTSGDFDGSGGVTFEDLVILAQNYGSGTSPDAARFGDAFAADWALALALVPEPGSLAALAAGVALAGRRRR